MDDKKIPRRQSKSDRVKSILDALSKHIERGLSNEEALEKLSIAQYDFLLDNNVNLDALTLTPQQIEAINIVKKSPRPTFPNGYKKKYPASKMELFGKLEIFVKENGGQIVPREKNNFRDLDFEIDGTKYKIVLSNPRVKKN